MQHLFVLLFLCLIEVLISRMLWGQTPPPAPPLWERGGECEVVGLRMSRIICNFAHRRWSPTHDYENVKNLRR